ncbi:MAG: hypothetical protein CM15mP12_3750 [Gammaproteobacteria bacterium]|nr:MAG: hypothetical protein CM15mP12_3750 [Gammaproteobacteria bacterium]
MYRLIKTVTKTRIRTNANFLPTMIKVPNMTCKAPINNREKIGNGTSRRMTISKLFSKVKI